MNEAQFISALSELEEGRGTYSQRQKNRLLRDVYDAIHPTKEEMDRALSSILNAGTRWLPTQSDIRDALISIRKGSHKPGDPVKPYTPCARCCKETPGFVFLRRDHASGAALAYGCGCSNTPPGLPILADVVKSGAYTLAHFENAQGKRCHEDFETWIDRRHMESFEARERIKAKGFKIEKGNFEKCFKRMDSIAPNMLETVEEGAPF